MQSCQNLQTLPDNNEKKNPVTTVVYHSFLIFCIALWVYRNQMTLWCGVLMPWQMCCNLTSLIDIALHDTTILTINVSGWGSCKQTPCSTAQSFQPLQNTSQTYKCFLRCHGTCIFLMHINKPWWQLIVLGIHMYSEWERESHNKFIGSINLMKTIDIVSILTF